MKQVCCVCIRVLTSSCCKGERSLGRLMVFGGDLGTYILSKDDDPSCVEAIQFACCMVVCIFHE